MKNNLHFGICDKQQSPHDSLALMVATAHLSRTQSYIFHKYDLSNAWKEYNLQQLVGPVGEYFVSYTRVNETSAGCLRSIYPSLGMRQLFGDVTMGQ